MTIYRGLDNVRRVRIDQPSEAAGGGEEVVAAAGPAPAPAGPAPAN